MSFDSERATTSAPGRRTPQTTVTAVTAIVMTLVFAGVAGIADIAGAQPYGTWMNTSSTSTGYIEVPHSPDLNPSTAMTLEMWVAVTTLGPGQCQSLVGKAWQDSWWVGVCGNTLRSFVAGDATVQDAGTIPSNRWTHIAVTYDGTIRRHYINGEEIMSWNDGVALTPSTEPMRIGSDVQWEVTPDASLDEVRLWSTARTTAQLREMINQEISSPMTGLVAAWNMNAGSDALGGHDGALVGTPGFLTFPVTIACFPSSTSLCLQDRFSVTVEWTAPDSSTGVGTVAPCGSDDTGLFWFFSPGNWELMVKVLDGCRLNNHYWVFSAATTNVAYRMEVLDVVRGANKVYFNYMGENAPAVTDTSALATCP